MEKFKPIEWVLIDCASQYGLDKKTFEERLEKGKEIYSFLRKNGIDKTVAKFDKADEPDMFVRALVSMSDIIKSGETAFPIGVDVASSGPQIDTTGIRDEEGMVTTGAISDCVPNLYLDIQKEMQKYLPINLTRERVKKATVPYVYGSTAVPKAVFGEYYGYFKKAFYKKVKGVVIVNNALIDAWDPTKTVYEHVLPDGFTARTISTEMKNFRMEIGKTSYTYMEEVLAPREKGANGTKALSANVTHSIDGYIWRELNRRCNWNEDKYYMALNTLANPKGGKNPRLERLEMLSRKYRMTSWQAIEYLQSGYVGNVSEEYLKHLRDFLTPYKEPFEVMGIHDEFMCLPGNVNTLKQIYNDILAELYRGVLLPQIISDYRGDDDIWEYVGKFNENTYEKIKHSRYAIS